MKTANFLSLSAFVILAGVFTSVGCSTPAVGELDENSAAASEEDEDEDDDTTSTKKKKSSDDEDEDEGDDDTTTGDTQTGDDDVDPAPSETGGSCATCWSKNAKAKKVDECLAQEQCQDEACFDGCIQSAGCSDQACMSVVEECDQICFEEQGGGEEPGGEEPPPGDGGECLSCVGTSGPAANYIKCSDQCQDAQCDEQCFEQACGANFEACDSKLSQCEAQCFGGGGEEF